MHSRIFIAGIAAALIAIPTMAATPSQTRLAHSENRDARQDIRIANGVTQGQINPGEAARLDARQGRIDSSQTRLTADGRYSRRDHARINHRQNRASAAIYRARHNRL